MLACNTVCKGPGCIAFYPRGRLSVFTAAAPATLDVWRDADWSYSGTVKAGTAWSAGVAPDQRVIVGEPDAYRVLALVGDPPAVNARWYGDVGSEFGASQLVLPAADGSDRFDLWVGAPGDNYGRGAVSLFRSAEQTTENSTPDLTLIGATPDDRFGSSITECADLDGDGKPEIAISAPNFAAPAGFLGPGNPADPIQDLAGAVFVVLSSQLDKLGDAPVRTTPWPDLARVYWGSDSGQGAGTSILCDRDLDSDGQVDVVIGSPWAIGNPGGRGEIQVLVNPLPPSGLLLYCSPSDPVDGCNVKTQVLGPDGEKEFYGISLTSLARPEPVLAVGATGAVGGAGRVYLIHGSELSDLADPVGYADFAPDYDGLQDHFGRVLSRADLDGDGVEDLVVGVPDAKGPTPNAFETGGIWVFYGSNPWQAETVAGDADVIVTGTQPFQRIGEHLAIADQNGDGIDELLVPTRDAAPTSR